MRNGDRAFCLQKKKKKVTDKSTHMNTDLSKAVETGSQDKRGTSSQGHKAQREKGCVVEGEQGRF